MTWLVFWFLFVFFLLVLPLAYGWGYRGWGFPYPVYRRRLTPEERAALDDEIAYEERVAEEESWGFLALFLWMIFAIALIWLLVAVL